jgi:hypothetical protein|tara:strand:- start:224 stop:481 length:258 start_codon:yes stop_codon:yes gene_type:complete
MTKFLVNIRAYGYHARFIVEAEDNAESIENSIVDKLGEKGVKWEKDGFTSRSIKWITYEEVLDANTFRPLQAEKEAGTGLGTASS